jgi:hypothetical protein
LIDGVWDFRIPGTIHFTMKPPTVHKASKLTMRSVTEQRKLATGGSLFISTRKGHPQAQVTDSVSPIRSLFRSFYDRKPS